MKASFFENCLLHFPTSICIYEQEERDSKRERGGREIESGIERGRRRMERERKREGGRERRRMEERAAGGNMRCLREHN